MAIRREIKAYIEAELRDYNDTLRAIGDDRDELLQQSPAYDNTGGSSYRFNGNIKKRDRILCKGISLMEV
jgi:hypothetical protein